MSRRIDRRALLLGAAGALAACNSQRPHEGLLGVGERVNERFQRLLFDPGRLARDPGPGTLTPFERFPKYHVAPVVPLAPAGWALRIGGMVRTPLTLDLDALVRLPRTEYRVRHHCVEGWPAVASWQGVQVRALARLAGADPAATCVEFRSFDTDAAGTPYHSSWDLASALHPQTILAYGMNGSRLPPGHGAPLRLYGPVKLGYKMVKYLTEVNFTPIRTGGYWEDQGYEWFAGI